MESTACEAHAVARGLNLISAAVANVNRIEAGAIGNRELSVAGRGDRLLGRHAFPVPDPAHRVIQQRVNNWNDE